MGFIRHKAMIVTGGGERLKKAHKKAKAIFKKNKVETSNITEIINSGMNGYESFAILPDGSKEGWPDSNLADKCRNELKEWLKNNQEGWNEWVEVSFGNDGGRANITEDNTMYENHPTF